MAYPLPVFDLSLAPPGKMTMPTIVGGGVEGGASASGITSVVDMTGGGYVAVKYSAIAFSNVSPKSLRYMNRLSGMLSGGIRPIVVPLLTDFTAPTVGDTGEFSTQTFGDGTRFTDYTQFSSNAVYPLIGLDAAVGVATVVLKMPAGVYLYGGEWFSILHPTLGQRAYMVTDVDVTRANSDGSTAYQIGIRPTLREAAANGTAATFDRPRCVMRLAPGTQIAVDVDAGWIASPEVSFVEYFGLVS